MLELIFYIFLFLVVYTYFLFPIVLYFIVKSNSFFKRKKKNSIVRDRLHSIGIVCAMYNEESVASKKIENFKNLSYKNKKIYIGSDGSSDKTNEILKLYSEDENIKIFEFPRRGKVHVINELMNFVSEDIIVFTDANSMFEHEALEKILECFYHSKIGTVCGRLKLVSNGNSSGEGFYWNYETLLKTLESEIECVMGGNGAIYAIRRNLFKPLPSTTINDDFTISLRVIEHGYGIVYAKDAIAVENSDHGDSVEFKRHVRDGAGHYRAVLHLFRLLNPFRIKICFIYLSHRLIRWSVPFLMIALLLLPVFCPFNIFLHSIAGIQVLFYLLVIIGAVTKSRVKIFYLPYYFVFINLALLLGFFKNILGMQKVTWNSTDRS